MQAYAIPEPLGSEEEKCFLISLDSIDSFLDFEREKGNAENVIRRFKTAIKSFQDFLPEDKVITRERLLSWRSDLKLQGYAAQTVANYTKHLNRYLDYIGCSEMRFNRGRPKDLTGQQFGFLTAITPTKKRDRKDIVWLCRCQCGKQLELPATRLLLGNTKSCGCLQKEHLYRVNKYFANTSIEQSIRDPIYRASNKSGFVGIVPKRDKWQAYITYQKKNHYLGTFAKLEDAVKARARAKEAVVADAMKLREEYEEMHKSDIALPKREVRK